MPINNPSSSVNPFAANPESNPFFDLIAWLEALNAISVDEFGVLSSPVPATDSGTSGIPTLTGNNTFTGLTQINSINGTSPTATGLSVLGASNQSAARTAVGATTVGSNLVALPNPSAITFPRINADNSVSALDAATFRTAIGAGTSSTTGTVTTVSVVSANNVSGSVANATTTPAITLTVGAATTSVSGIVELATDAEVQTGSDTVRAVVPSSLAAWWTFIKTQAATIAGAWTFSSNIVGNGTNNTFPNQGGVVPGSTTSIIRSQLDDQRINPRIVLFRDDFNNGGRTNQIIGETGWGLSGTGASAAERGGSGVYPNQSTVRLTSSAILTQFCRTFTCNTLLGGSANWATRTGWYSTFIFAIPDITSATVAIGFSGNPNAIDFQDRLVGIRYKAGVDTNYQFICKNDTSTFAASASSTLVDSTVAPVNNTFVKIEMSSIVAGTIQFSINGAAWQSISTNVPTSMTGLFYFWVEPQTNSARSIDMDFVAWKVDTSR